MSDQYETIFTFEIAFAISLCIFLWNLTLLVRIRYGKQLITHLTVWPYVVCLLLEVLMILEFLSLSYIANVHFKGTQLQKLNDFIFNQLSNYNQVWIPMELSKGGILQIFFVLRIHEYEALLMFCFF